MPIWPRLKEKIIFHEIKKGDQQSFVWLYDNFAPKLYRFLFLKTSSSHTAEDLCSEVFLRFWQQISTKNQTIQNPKSFLYQVANNLLVDHYRQKAKSDFLLNEDQAQKLANTAPATVNLAAEAMISSDLDQIRTALNQLKPDYQNLIIWHYLDDFSVKDIAQITQKPENAVRVKLHRALKALKSVIK